MFCVSRCNLILSSGGAQFDEVDKNGDGVLEPREVKRLEEKLEFNQVCLQYHAIRWPRTRWSDHFQCGAHPAQYTTAFR